MRAHGPRTPFRNTLYYLFLVNLEGSTKKCCITSLIDSRIRHLLLTNGDTHVIMAKKKKKKKRHLILPYRALIVLFLYILIRTKPLFLSSHTKTGRFYAQSQHDQHAYVFIIGINICMCIYGGGDSVCSMYRIYRKWGEYIVSSRCKKHAS